MDKKSAAQARQEIQTPCVPLGRKMPASFIDPRYRPDATTEAQHTEKPRRRITREAAEAALKALRRHQAWTELALDFPMFQPLPPPFRAIGHYADDDELTDWQLHIVEAEGWDEWRDALEYYGWLD
jgi:hypothetical protein